MRLHSEKYAAIITGFLSDDRRGLVRTARNLIVKTVAPDYAIVTEIFRATPYVNTKQKCFSVLLTASKWQRLLFILDALEIGGDEMIEAAKIALERWMGAYNRSFIKVTPAQAQKIRESIERLGGRLSARTQRQLLFLSK